MLTTCPYKLWTGKVSLAIYSIKERNLSAVVVG